MSKQTSDVRIIEVPEGIVETMPQRYQMLRQVQGNPRDLSTQELIQFQLMQDPIWAQWVATFPSRIQDRPWHVKAGLGFSRDDEDARRLLVGLARCIQPGSFVPTYPENLAVTEVMAFPDTDKESHTKNDLPAPPHVAAFFKQVLPHTCYFACIRPHPFGGGETTVVNLDAVLELASPLMIGEWENRTYYLRTSEYHGNKLVPFKLLTYIDGFPFLRYRREFTVDFDSDLSLTNLQKLVCDPANHYKVLLQSDEILIHWNGAPHSRLPQRGSTPEEVSKRRKLIRCRTQPLHGWEKNFESPEGNLS